MGSGPTIIGNARLVGAAFMLFMALLGSTALPGCGDGSDYVPTYDVEISGLGAFRLGALQLEIEYLGDRGGFLGRGDNIECVPLVQALVAANHVTEHVAKVGMISLEGIVLPAPLMRCGFRTREELTPDSFSVLVTDASDTDSLELDPYPAVVVSTVALR